MKKTGNNPVPRSPVVVIMGHIDHGKSTLLDYIRKTNVVGTETGGITQRLSAYEAVHKTKEGVDRAITFLDTPGHEAFRKMRLHGAEVADIATLVVSAEDGVKAQTLEALESIKQAGISFVVALNKIDKPNANVEKTKQELLENEVYLEGMGGEVPWVAISAKRGDGVPDLLDVMLLLADLAELAGDPSENASGLVIEADCDPKKGMSATLIIKNGTLKSGMYVVAGASISPVRIFENFRGEPIKEARFSCPVRVVGFNSLPEIGAPFSSHRSKREAERASQAALLAKPKKARGPFEKQEGNVLVIPLVLKADVAGSLDAIEHELKKLESDTVVIQLISRGVGAVTESDIKLASASEDMVVIGFNAPVDSIARDTADRLGIKIQAFDIIYKLSEWVAQLIKQREPRPEAEEVIGQAEVLKTFSKSGNRQVVGARMSGGALSVGKHVRIVRREVAIGHGKISNLQQHKVDTKRVETGEFGARVDAAISIAPGDMLEVAGAANGKSTP